MMVPILCYGRSFTLDVAILDPKKVVHFIELLWADLGRPALEHDIKPPERDISSLHEVLVALIKAFSLGSQYGPKLYLPQDDNTLRRTLFVDLLNAVGGPDSVTAGGHPAIAASELVRLGYHVDLLVPYPERRPGLEGVSFIVDGFSVTDPGTSRKARISLLIRITPGTYVQLDKEAPIKAQGSTRVLLVDRTYRPILLKEVTVHVHAA